MNHNLITSGLLAILLAAACSPVEAPDKHGHDHAAAEAAAHEQQEPEGMPTVLLDNGKTWAANPETTEGVEAMKALVDGFDPGIGDGAALKEGLAAEFKDIFAKCTMTGEAHEQLHHYLVPIKAMLDNLGDQPTPDELSALSDYLGTYPDYFH